MKIAMNNKRPDLKLNSFQENYLLQIKSLDLSLPPNPWQQAMSISAAGVIACGWTSDDRILVVSADGYSINDPLSSPELLSFKSGAPYEFFSDDNLSFKPDELYESVKVFGLLGGDGNHVTSDGWKLEILYPQWPNCVIGIRIPSPANTYLERWQGIYLIRLKRLEHFDLKCGFSNDQKKFLISGSAGVEVYIRP